MLYQEMFMIRPETRNFIRDLDSRKKIVLFQFLILKIYELKVLSYAMNNLDGKESCQVFKFVDGYK